MTTAVAKDFTAPLLGGHSHFLLRRLHSLTGLVFGGYLVVHLIVNATIAQMATVYQVQVDKIHSLPFLWAFEWGLIYLPILYHTVYGIWITFTGQPNIDRYPYAKNWFYTLQRASALVIVVFLAFHILTLKVGVSSRLAFDPHAASYSVHRHMTASWFIAFVIYPLGIIASCYHLANGFWTAAITWGLTISAGAQRRWGLGCGGIFVLMMICGFTALVASMDSRLGELDQPAAHVEVRT